VWGGSPYDDVDYLKPVAFARETFAAYREWVAAARGECYFDAVLRFIAAASTRAPERGLFAALLGAVTPTPTPTRLPGKPDINLSEFCWMCPLGTFLQTTGMTLGMYALINVDDAAYQRFAIHTPYEPAFDPLELAYAPTARRAVEEGLCRARGADVVPSCAGVGREFIDVATFTYSDYTWARRNESHLDRYVAPFRAAERASR